MRKAAPGPTLSVTVLIIIVNVVVFFIQYGGSPQTFNEILRYGALSLEGVQHWQLWQFFTFQFLHGGVMHLVVNSVTLYMFGRILEDSLGKRSFLTMYLLSGVAGGVLQILLALIWESMGGPMVGASAGISGVLGAMAMLRPDLIFLIAFVLPISARYFIWLVIGFSAVCLVFGWVPGVAHGAHLGGTLFGLAYVRWLRGASGFAMVWQRLMPGRRSRPILKVRFPKTSSSWEAGEGTPRRGAEGDFMSKEIDPILEKISAHGIQSLTPHERELLEKARQRMDPR